MNKILWIDVIKGLGILTVVAGHIYEGEIARNIYIFHMPLFFFISGYLFKSTIEYKKYFKKKVIHLLVPYFSFLILLDYKVILGFAYNLFVNSLNDDKWLFYKEHFYSIIYGGGELTGDFAVFWFVTCLFLTQQIFNYLFNKLKTRQIFMLILAMLIINYANTYFYPKMSVPWNANVILASIPIFYIGYLYKQKNFRINTVLLWAIGFATILLSFYYPENVYNMKYSSYGIPIITLASSLILILNIKYISVLLSNYKFPYRVLSRIGQASMVIMFLHQSFRNPIALYISDNNTFVFLITTMLSYFIYLLLSKFKLSKAIFLGSHKDLEEIYLSTLKRKSTTANNVYKK